MVSGSKKKSVVLKLVDHTCDARFWSPLEMLKDAVEDLEGCPEENDYNKAIIIFLDDSGSDLRVSHAVAGMKRSEIIALLEAMKLKFLRGLIGDSDA